MIGVKQIYSRSHGLEPRPESYYETANREPFVAVAEMVVAAGTAVA